MTKWKALRATFPEDEFEEIERIKDKYNISYNEIIRSGVKFYIGLTLIKELLASTGIAKALQIRGKSLSTHLTSREYQSKMEQKITSLIKVVAVDLIGKAIEFEERTTSLRMNRKVGRPKKKRKVGRPTQYD